MALLNKRLRLNTILTAFTKPLAELDAFMLQEEARELNAQVAIEALSERIQDEVDCIEETKANRVKAAKVRNKLKELIE